MENIKYQETGSGNISLGFLNELYILSIEFGSNSDVLGEYKSYDTAIKKFGEAVKYFQ